MICLVIAEKDLDSIINSIKEYPNADLYELRLDYLERSVEYTSNLISAIRRHISKPIILTNRHKNEGGNSCQSEEERISLLINYLHERPDYIDVELSTDKQLRNELISQAKRFNTKIIVSYHNFSTTPPLNELIDIKKQAQELDADIIKIATNANSKDDLLKILKLYEKVDEANYKLLAFNMGKLGKITRVLALYLGAPFMYVSKNFSQRPAPGQLSINEIKTILSILEDK